MIIIKIPEERLTDINHINTIINEVIRTSFPDNLHNWLKSISNRKEMLKDFGNKAFLLPNELKFPVCNPETGKFDCSLIYIARLRIRQYDILYKDLTSKAENLYNKCNCTKNISVNVKEHNRTYDLLELLDILHLDFSTIHEDTI